MNKIVPTDYGTVLTLERLEVVLTYLEDDWFRIDIFFTDYDSLSKEGVDIGYGFKIPTEILSKPIFSFSAHVSDIMDENHYQNFIADMEKYIVNSPLSDFILDAVEASRYALAWSDKWSDTLAD